MSDVDTGIVGLDGAVDTAIFHVTPDDITPHAQGQHLFVVEYVLDDGQCAAIVGGAFCLGVFFFAPVVQFGNADANAKLLATVGTLEKERLPFFISGFIKSDVMIALRASHALHKPMGLKGNRRD